MDGLSLVINSPLYQYNDFDGGFIADVEELKNELDKINYVLGTTISSTNMDNLERSILGLNNKQYTPRINKELFGV